MTRELGLAILALAAGVILSKALPALLAPAASNSASPWRRFLDLMPPVIMGSLTAITATGGHPLRANPWMVAAVAMIGVGLLVARGIKHPKGTEQP